MESCLHKVYFELAKTINVWVWDKLDNIMYLESQRMLKSCTYIQTKKVISFFKVRCELHNNKIVINNLTDRCLGKATLFAVKKGANFTVAPCWIPYEDIICAVENTIKHLNPETSNEIKQDVSLVLRKTKLPESRQPNISREEGRALIKLREDGNLVVVPADKGNVTVILNISNYTQKNTRLTSQW